MGLQQKDLAVRIEGQRLSKVAAEKNASVEQLAQAIERPSLKGKKAISAVTNWMRNNDHPRCKAEDVRKLADALGVEASRIAKFTCIYKFHRGSPRKASLLTDLIRGKPVLTAQNLLTFTTKRAAVDIKKALLSAIADAEAASADTTKLVVIESAADKAIIMKRIHQKDRGRAHSIHKPMSHIIVSLAEK